MTVPGPEEGKGPIDIPDMIQRAILCMPEHIQTYCRDNVAYMVFSSKERGRHINIEDLKGRKHLIILRDFSRIEDFVHTFFHELAHALLNHVDSADEDPLHVKQEDEAIKKAEELKQELIKRLKSV